MLAETRRKQILTQINTDGQVSTDTLAEKLEVSVETIRRDLGVLEKRSALTRVHGGAMRLPITSVAHESPYRERSLENAAQKYRIGAYVAASLPAKATIFLDIGTTVEAVVAALPENFHGTFITTSLRIGMELARLPHAEVLTSGGRIRHDELSMSGPAASEFLINFHPDIAVISVGALKANTGITDYDFEEVQLKKIVMQNAAKSYVVADSSKIGKVAPYGFCPVDIPHAIITDEKLSSAEVSRLEKAGANLIIA